MAVKLIPKEFYRSLARRTNISVEQCQKFWELLNEFFIQELLRNGSIVLPNMGELSLVLKGGKNGHVPDNENKGKTKIVYIEPYYQIVFRPSEVFKQNVNNNRIPRAEIKRERERYRNYIETEQTAEKRRKMLESESERIEKARLERRERALKRREKQKLSNKKLKELEQLEKMKEVNPYDYGNIEE